MAMPQQPTIIMPCKNDLGNRKKVLKVRKVKIMERPRLPPRGRPKETKMLRKLPNPYSAAWRRSGK
jgi:hypothetical protein